MTFQDSEVAFQTAIDDGYLSTDPAAPNYAGRYMYMHTDLNPNVAADGWKHLDYFKNIETRAYDIIVPGTWL